VLRGLLDHTTFSAIKVGSYQRGNLQDRSLAESFEDKDARLPDIELAMRGHTYHREGDTFDLVDPVFVLDGLQRISAAQDYINCGGDPVNVEIGALINLDSTENWEKARFEVLNRNRIRVSADLILRNRRDRHSGLIMVYELSTHAPEFPLHGRVCWGQRRARNELMGAYTLAKVVCTLHRGVIGVSSRLEDVIGNLDTCVRRIGGDVMRANVLTFFNLIEESWVIRELPFVRSAIPVNEAFLAVMAQLLAEHDTFWTGKEPRVRLSIPDKWKQKFRAFPIDGHVITLVKGGGAKSAKGILYEMVLRHMNTGKTAQRLTPRDLPEWLDDKPIPRPKKRPGEDKPGEEARP
jgi:hypothetical protein